MATQNFGKPGLILAVADEPESALFRFPIIVQAVGPKILLARIQAFGFQALRFILSASRFGTGEIVRDAKPRSSPAEQGGILLGTICHG